MLCNVALVRIPQHNEPIFDRGDPTGPMLNGITYIVRPSMHPANLLFSSLLMLLASAQLPRVPFTPSAGVGTESVLSSVHMKVRDSTLATSLGSVLARYEFSNCSSLVKRPSAISLLISL